MSKVRFQLDVARWLRAGPTECQRTLVSAVSACTRGLPPARGAHLTVYPAEEVNEKHAVLEQFARELGATLMVTQHVRRSLELVQTVPRPADVTHLNSQALGPFPLTGHTLQIRVRRVRQLVDGLASRGGSRCPDDRARNGGLYVLIV